MPDKLYLDYYIIGIPVIFVTIILILYIQKIVRDKLGKETIIKCHEVGSYYLQVVGTFYAVLLGLIVVDSMTKFQQAQASLDQEANALVAIYSSAERFPEQRKSLEKLVINYTNEVLNTELSLMENTEKWDPKARDFALEMLQQVKQIEPVTENQKAIYPILLSEVSDLLTARRERIKISNFGEPPIEWIMLIAGGIITLTLTFFFTIESHGIHMFMRAVVSLMILMSLYLTYLFGSPFSGDLKVSDDPYKMVLAFTDWAHRNSSKTDIQRTEPQKYTEETNKNPQVDIVVKSRIIKKR